MFRCAASAFAPVALKMHRKPPSEMIVAAASGSASAAASSRSGSSMVGGWERPDCFFRVVRAEREYCGRKEVVVAAARLHDRTP
jgi:hypothetical protein